MYYIMISFQYRYKSQFIIFQSPVVMMLLAMLGRLIPQLKTASPHCTCTVAFFGHFVIVTTGKCNN